MTLKIDGTTIHLSRDIIFEKDGKRKKFRNQGNVVYNQSQIEAEYYNKDLEPILIKNLIAFYEFSIRL